MEKQNNFLRERILEKLWGKADKCEELLPIVDQFIKQGTSHLYLDDRLVVYSNHMLFDIKLTSGQS
jgi:hypothetical protein